MKGIPTTSVTRTLIDLAAILPRSTLEKALDEALRRGMTDVGRLRRVLLLSGWRRRGGRVLRALLSERDGAGEKTDSELEDRVIRLIRRRRLPTPVVHFNVVHGDEWIGEIDLAYPEERIAIEVHGYSVHSRKRVWENDQRRENELVRAGWRLLKATSSQLDQDPDSLIDTLRSLLKRSRTSRPA